ncbi:MAG: PorP/SprF family type IX secretion system membrane protein [Chitinophagaceae bacterium]|nr:PorP/SprF family type IX secretion system membrane protein [Chitinophagaceae bacterium]
MKFQLLRKAMIGLALISATWQSQAQDIHFTQFDASPLIINPAFTGAFSGMYRASAIYRNQWGSVTTPFVTYSATFDAPITRDISRNDYLAAGVNLYNDRSGDGNLTNLSALASLAYHKALDEDGNKMLSVGLQGGYSQKTIDLARLYWGDEFYNGGFQPGTTGEQLKPKTKYFTGNAGLAWGHRLGDRFSYQLGVAGFNLNQPRESLLKKSNNEVGLGMRINAQIGADIMASERLFLRPAFLFQTQTSAREMIAGNEFLYIVGQSVIKSDATSVFVGLWDRFGDAVLVTGGIESHGFRVGISYDYNTSSLKAVSNGQGGFEISLRYIKPNPLDFARRVIFPCARF